MRRARLSAVRVVPLAIGLALLISFSGVNAAKYPAKPVTLVVALSAGGTTDMMARALAGVAEKYLGQRIVVVNKPGGATLVGTHYVAKQAPADGYTWAIGTPSPLVIFFNTKKDMPYTPEDLVPICQIVNTPILLSVRTDSPWKNIHELLDYARRNPGKLTVAHPTTGGQNHLAIAAFFKKAGVEVTHVPMDGGAKAQAALLGRQVDAVVQHHSEGAPTFASGETKALVILDDKRSPLLPDVPTAIESGVDISIGGWMGMLVPAGVPDDIVQTIRDVMRKAVNSDEFKKLIENMGEAVEYLDQSEFAAKLKRESETWREVAQLLGLEKQ